MTYVPLVSGSVKNICVYKKYLVWCFDKENWGLHINHMAFTLFDIYMMILVVILLWFFYLVIYFFCNFKLPVTLFKIFLFRFYIFFPDHTVKYCNGPLKVEVGYVLLNSLYLLIHFFDLYINSLTMLNIYNGLVHFSLESGQNHLLILGKILKYVLSE
jgi:hypothetical protein